MCDIIIVRFITGLNTNRASRPIKLPARRGSQPPFVRSIGNLINRDKKHSTLFPYTIGPPFIRKLTRCQLLNYRARKIECEKGDTQGSILLEFSCEFLRLFVNQKYYQSSNCQNERTIDPLFF